MSSDSDRLVCLQGGLVVPREAFDLVLAVERQGLTLTIDGADVIVAGDGLHHEDLDALRRLKPYVHQLLRYVADDRHLFDARHPHPVHGPVVVTRQLS